MIQPDWCMPGCHNKILLLTFLSTSSKLYKIAMFSCNVCMLKSTNVRTRECLKTSTSGRQFFLELQFTDLKSLNQLWPVGISSVSTVLFRSPNSLYILKTKFIQSYFLEPLVQWGVSCVEGLEPSKKSCQRTILNDAKTLSVSTLAYDSSGSSPIEFTWHETYICC